MKVLVDMRGFQELTLKINPSYTFSFMTNLFAAVDRFSKKV